MVCIFEGTYYGPTPNMFTHIFALQRPMDICCAILPHLCVIFPPMGKIARGDHEGWQVA